MFPRVLMMDPRFFGLPAAAKMAHQPEAEPQQHRPPHRTDSTASSATNSPDTSWPSVFDEDVAALADIDLLHRGHDVVAYIMNKCRFYPANVVDAQPKCLTIVTTFIVPGTLNEVLDVFSRDPQLGFQAFLLRVFQDALTEAMSVRRVAPTLRRHSPREGSVNDEHSSNDSNNGQDDHFAGCTASIKALKLQERRLFRTSRHELQLLDFVQKLSESAFVRVFKTLDHKRTDDGKMSRLTNVLFGFHMDEVHAGGVKVTYFGQHVGKKHAFAHTMLQQLASSVGLLATAVWRRRLVRLSVAGADHPTSTATRCHLCSNNLSRRTQTQCRLCDRAVCTNCSLVERGESARCVEVDIRVCNVCLAQCQANLILTNKAVAAAKPRRYRHHNDDGDGNEDDDGGLPRISEVLGAGQVRHRGYSAAKSVTAAPLHATPSARRVLSGVRGFSTPRGASGHYVAPPTPSGMSTPQHPKGQGEGVSLVSSSTPLVSRQTQYTPQRDLSQASPPGRGASTVAAASRQQVPSSSAKCPPRGGLDAIRVSAQAETLRQNAFSNRELHERLEKMCVSLAGALDCHHAYVSLLYKGGFVMKATSGMAPSFRISRGDALSVATLENGLVPLVVPDATVDPRFNSSIRVTGRECIRYYVGLTLVTADGIELGTVSVSDGLPRARFDATHRRLLHWFGSTIVDEIEQCCR